MPAFRIDDPALPPWLHGPVLLDGSGRLRYWATVDAFLSHADQAPSSAAARLAAIERLYVYAEGLWPHDSLDAVLCRRDLRRVHDLLHGFFSMLRNSGVRTGHPSERVWQMARAFAVRSCEQLAAGDPRELRRVRGVLDGLARLGHHLAPGSNRPRQPRGLPAAVIDDLYGLALPDSSRNPFRTEALRWRNFVIVLLLLHQGLRRGELLQLPADAVKDGVDRRHGRPRSWLNVSTNPHEILDPRGATPRLKNALAVRQIPISRPVAEAIDNYVVNFRGKQARSYMFSSQGRRPLSLRAINKLFQVLTCHLSEAARRELWNLRRPIRISPHDLRHTCAAVRLGQLVGDDTAKLPAAIEQLRPFFGWSRSSDMPRLYARTYFEARIADVWRDDFDARVEFLRRVP
jgi:integrase